MNDLCGIVFNAQNIFKRTKITLFKDEKQNNKKYLVKIIK